MNKSKIIIAVLATSVLFCSTSFALFDNKQLKEAEEKLATANAANEKSIKDTEKMKADNQELNNKITALTKENEALKQDRENLMSQAKSLLTDSGHAKELSEANAKLSTDKAALEAERDKLRTDNASMTNELNKIKAENEGMSKELNDYRSNADRIKKEATIKELEKKVSDLKKWEGEARQLSDKKSKVENENSELEKKLDKLKKDYAEALKVNKAFEREIKNMPKKFSEIARQNTHLIKETSEMHYNMGVFYTKAKEYDRARVEFEKAIEINPDDAYAHFNVGYIYAEHIVDRKKAINHFKQYLRLSKSGDKDVDWVRKYILTWDAYEGKETMQ